jgi:hypothetical protein
MTNPTRHPHDGSACPVSPGTRVRVWFRNGKSNDNLEAGDWSWDSKDHDYSIAYYQVLEPDWAVEGPKLVEALEPFARVAKHANDAEDIRVFGRADYAVNDFREITVGDLRRARTALSRIKGEEG